MFIISCSVVLCGAVARVCACAKGRETDIEVERVCVRVCVCMVRFYENQCASFEVQRRRLYVHTKLSV